MEIQDVTTIARSSGYFSDPRSLLSLALLTSMLVIERSASAQTAPISAPSEDALAARRTLIERAQTAASVGRHSEALQHAEAAARIENSPSLRLFIAQQRVALGRHAAAIVAADQCVREATHNTALERRDSILTQCRQIARDSQRMVVLVSLTVPPSPREGLTVRIGDRAVTGAEVGTPLNVDSGMLNIEITAPGVEPFREQREGVAGAVLALTIPARFGGASTASATSATSTSSVPTTTTQTAVSIATNATESPTPPRSSNGSVSIVQTPPPIVSRRQSSLLRPLGWVVGAVGLATVGGSMIALKIREDAAAVANTDLCINEQTASCSERRQTAESLAPVSLGLGIAGGVIALAGVGMLVGSFVSSEPSNTTRVAVMPVVTPQSALLVVGGSL